MSGAGTTVRVILGSVLHALIFVVLGPIVGGLVFLVFLVFALGGSLSDMTPDILPGLAGGILAPSFIIGGLPALGCGLVAAFLRNRTPRVKPWIIAILGAALQLPFALMFFSAVDWMVIFVIADGALAALVCWYLGLLILPPRRSAEV